MNESYDLQRSSVPLSPPSWTFSLHDAPAKQIVSWRTPPTPPTSYHQENGSGASTAFSPDCESPPPKPYHIMEKNVLCTLLCVHNPTKDSIVYVWLHARALQITLHCSPASCLTYDVSLCTCTVFIWSIRTVSIVCIFLFMYRVSFIYSIFIVKICQ